MIMYFSSSDNLNEEGGSLTNKILIAGETSKKADLAAANRITFSSLAEPLSSSPSSLSSEVIESSSSSSLLNSQSASALEEELLMFDSLNPFEKLCKLCDNPTPSNMYQFD
jgi:hypothetical protein